MKPFCRCFLILLINISAVYANEGIESPHNRNCPTKDIKATVTYPCEEMVPLDPCEDDDPFELVNRGIFFVNQAIDCGIIRPIVEIYVTVVPKYVQGRVSYILRNLNEPIVFANNLLQGELDDASVTIWRLLLNSTIGVAGIFDVSTDLGLVYKKEDLGLTFASWGIPPGPYLVLPILGPSTLRDGFGRLGDYALDPINWWTFGLQSTSRSCIQIVDAKADTIEIMDDLQKNAIDPYSSIRIWYGERRKSLTIVVEDRQAVDTAHPEEDEDYGNGN